MRVFRVGFWKGRARSQIFEATRAPWGTHSDRVAEYKQRGGYRNCNDRSYGTTIVYAWLTGVLAIENRRLRKAGTEPEVIAYLFPDARHINILHMVVANVAKGAAKNVSIEFEADADDFASHGKASGVRLCRSCRRMSGYFIFSETLSRCSGQIHQRILRCMSTMKTWEGDRATAIIKPRLPILRL